MIFKNNKSNTESYISTYGYQAWYKNYQRHRLNGPAIIYDDGYKEWWENVRRIIRRDNK